MFGNSGKWAFVFPKAYEQEARETVRYLYVYIRELVMQEYQNSPSEVDDDIACWFTAEARDKSEHMVFKDGKVITEEGKNQDEALRILEGTNWFAEEESPPDAKTASIPTVNKSIRKFDSGDTASIHSQNTTNTMNISRQLEQAILRAEETPPRDSENQDKEPNQALADTMDDQSESNDS